MKCPVCQNEMIEGGLFVDGVLVRWVPLDTYNKKGIGGLVYTGNKVLEGKTNHIINKTKIPNAYYCENCNKVVGIFDISE